jgi:hypothetical protein
LTEEWRWVPGWEGFYEVSNYGSVRSVDRLITWETRLGPRASMLTGKPRSPTIGTDGYLHVTLSRPGPKRENLAVHRLVALAFLGPPPPGSEVCHNDGVRTNNKISNLRWGTRASNFADKLAHGTAGMGPKHPMAKLSEEEALLVLRSSDSGIALAARLGVSPNTIYDIRGRRSWRHLDQGLPGSVKSARL